MLSIVIPCFNEEKIIQNSVNKINSWVALKKIKTEIILVNNKSTDNTLKKLKELEILENIFVLNEDTRGKGFAVKKGLEFCNFGRVLILDADLSTDIAEFKLNWLKLKNTLIMGSRSLGIEINTPIKRKISGKVFNFIVRSIFKFNIKDTQCGFKYISSDDISSIAKEISFSGFSYDIDLINICKNLGYNILEVPVTYKFNENSSVSLIRDSYLMLRDLFLLKKKFK